MTLSRRDLLVASAMSAPLIGSVPGALAETCGRQLSPTTAIPTIPEYIPGAPMRTSFLRDDVADQQRIRLFGRALTTTCEPLRDARIDFWHTDQGGAYDMQGHKFRGAQRTDRDGRFVLETVMAGRYNGPPHIHFLLVARPHGRPQPLMLSGTITFPTAEEYAAAKDHPPDLLSPQALKVSDNVLIAPCDIVLELA